MYPDIWAARDGLSWLPQRQAGMSPPSSSSSQRLGEYPKWHTARHLRAAASVIGTKQLDLGRLRIPPENAILRIFAAGTHRFLAIPLAPPET